MSEEIFTEHDPQSVNTVAIKSLPSISEEDKFKCVTHDLGNIIHALSNTCNFAKLPDISLLTKVHLLSIKDDVDKIQKYFETNRDLAAEKYNSAILENILDYSKVELSIINQHPIIDDTKDEYGLLKKLVNQKEALREELADIPQFMNLDEYPVKKEKIDLVKAIPTFIDNIRSDIHHREHHLRVIPNEKPVECEIDVTLTEKILENFIFNSIKYTNPRKEPNIVISCGQIDGHTKISVTDFGIGISAKNLEKLKKIKPGKETRFAKDVAEGSGFGLYNSIAYALKMGAYIEIHSEGEGRGTTCSIVF